MTHSTVSMFAKNAFKTKKPGIYLDSSAESFPLFSKFIISYAPPINSPLMNTLGTCKNVCEKLLCLR